MEQLEVKNVASSIMALRPQPVASKREPSRTKEQAKRREVIKKISDLEFEREIKMIMEGEIPDYSAFFFKSHQPVKGKNKNDTFNPYYGEKR